VPALVLLDALLPDGDGIDLLRAIRAHPRWHAVPVLVLSGRSGDGDIVRALAAGANDYMLKPFQPWQLLERVRGLVPR
jgi:DNA-binding response OmpR family regulator